MQQKIIGRNSGITLIALIVTIIVLLILAGISITMLIGENGLITKANWSKFVTEYSTVKEGKDLYEIEQDIDKTSVNTKNKYSVLENGKIENSTIMSTLEVIKIYMEKY